jgi:DNA-binding NarL/FixJ family response regulator
MEATRPRYRARFQVKIELWCYPVAARCGLRQSCMTTIVLAEDHKLVREGLSLLLARDPTLEIVGEANDGEQAVKLVEKLKPGLLLLDLMLPRLHGLDVLRKVRKFRTTKVVVVSMHADEPHVSEAFRNGADGYVLKDSGATELLKAIRSVLSDHRYLSPSLPSGSRSPRKASATESDVSGTLSARERLVLQLGAEGHTSAQIGKQLFISRRTVESHRSNLMKKLSLRSQTDLVRFAIRKRLINP